MTESEQDEILRMLVETLAQISQNVERIAAVVIADLEERESDEGGEMVQ